MRILPLCAIAGAIAVSTNVSAQEVVEESFSKQVSGSYLWNLTGPTATNLTRGKTDTRSFHGKVDEIRTAKTIQYSRTAITLDPGTYIATFKAEKFSAATGAEDFTMTAITGATPTPSVTWAVADQKLDKLVNTKAIVFTLRNKFPVTFQLQAKTTTATKTNYRFDSFHIGKVERGHAVLVESMNNTWGFSHGCPHTQPNVRDTSSPYGFVRKISARGSSPCGTGSANWWWTRMWSSSKSFLPGVHTAHMRFKKIVDNVGAHNFVWWYRVSTDGGTTWKAGTIRTWLSSRHTLNKWVYSPNLSFNVTNPAHLYQFRLDAFRTEPNLKQTNSFKSNYHMDTLEVRRGEFERIGASCMNAGKALMEGNVPQLQEKFDVTVGPLGSIAGPVMMILGLNAPNIDLSGIPGWGPWACDTSNKAFLYARLDIVIPMTVASGEAKFSATLPNDKSLLNLKWWMQAYETSGSFPTTTNGVRGTVGN